jgi:hypothetical protein
MSDLVRPGDGVARAIDKAAIRESILRNTVPVTDWATARLLRERNADGCIGELYANYEDYCRREKCPSLGRKTWIAVLKLAGFETQSGAFTGLKLKTTN